MIWNWKSQIKKCIQSSDLEKYGELLAAGTDATSDEMRDLHNTMLTNQDVNANLVNYYIKFLKYLMVHGKYENSDLVEILDADGNDIPGISASQLKNLVSITDVIDKHSKMSALRKLAEFIITGEVDDVHKEMEQAVDGFEEQGEKETETDDFESMLDYEGIDLENPFDEEE